MRQHYKIYIILFFIVLLFVGYGVIKNLEVQPPSKELTSKFAKEQNFLRDGLKTDTAITSTSLDKVLGGGPGKDGIPTLTNPAFVSVSEAAKFLKDDMEGIKVTVGNTTRFYPYNILVWHEIVNDVIEGKSLVVTFCPLCGSAIVFDAEVGGTAETFGVSGKLYESNLLMYDKTTESLWSQIIGEAVVGERTGAKLSVYPSQVISFKNLKARYGEAQVLSVKTGYSRDYAFYPYGDYNENADLIFPVSVSDNRFPAKEIMYIVNVGEKSAAFKWKDLSETQATVAVGSEEITAIKKNGEVEAKDSRGEIIPGYYAMWFSWAAHHQEDGVVWQKK
jgi:hypothetical protein